MYHLSSKAKTLFMAIAVNGRQARSLAPQARAIFTLNKKVNEARMLFDYSRRTFALPPHVKLEMPNLSPTMEKVTLFISKAALGKYLEVDEEGGRLDQAGRYPCVDRN